MEEEINELFEVLVDCYYDNKGQPDLDEKLKKAINTIGLQVLCADVVVRYSEDVGRTTVDNFSSFIEGRLYVFNEAMNRFTQATNFCVALDLVGWFESTYGFILHQSATTAIKVSKERFKNG